MELEKELQDLVSKHLPQATGDALRKRLEQADKDAKDLSGRRSELAVERMTITDLQNMIKELNDLKIRKEVVEKGEKDLANNQRSLEIEKLKYQLQCEKEKTEMAVSLNASLTRNTLYRKSIYDSESQAAYQNSNGVWVSPTPITKSFTETRSEE